MSTTYRTSGLLFEEKPQIKLAPKGVREEVGLFCVSGQAKITDREILKTYYLHRERDGKFFWRRDLWKHGRFADEVGAEKALAEVAGEIRLCK